VKLILNEETFPIHKFRDLHIMHLYEQALVRLLSKITKIEEEQLNWFKEDFEEAKRGSKARKRIVGLLPTSLRSCKRREASIDAINKLDNFEKSDFRSLKCSRCATPVRDAHYLCRLCRDGKYILCQGCADCGLICDDTSHDLMKRTIDLERGRIINGEDYTRAKGIRVDIRGQIYFVIGDTGSEFTIISEERCHELGLEMVRKRQKIKMRNSKKLVSRGTVELHLQFSESLGKIPPVVAHVVRDFTFDILLGGAFLDATETTTRFINRFVGCLFPTRNLWAFYRLGKTTQRFEGMMGDGIPFLGLPDTGSRRNIMRADWAL
jgi:hypothetical protein